MGTRSESENAIPSPELIQLAERQGIKPVDLDELLSKGPRGPEDETADLMIKALHQWRGEIADRDLP
jgi:hypothetical protein